MRTLAIAVVALFAAGLSAATADALVVEDGTIYWIRAAKRGDATGRTAGIGRMNVDGTGLRRLLVRGVDADHLAVGGGHVFWSGPLPGDDTGHKRVIGRARLDGKRVQRRLVRTGAGSIAVHGRFLYWSGAAAIGRARLDGKRAQRRFVKVPRAGWALGGLAVGDAGIFWGQGLDGVKAWRKARRSGPTGRIGRADLTGRGRDADFASWRSAALMSSGPDVVGLDGPSLYWRTPNPDNVLHHLAAEAPDVGYCQPVFSNCEVLMRLADERVNPNSRFAVEDGVLYWAEPVRGGTRIYRAAIARETIAGAPGASEMLRKRERVAFVRDQIS